MSPMPMPPGGMAGAACFLGLSATMASVVIKSEAILLVRLHRACPMATERPVPRPMVWSPMQLADEQLAIIITWAKKTPEVQAVFLYGSRVKGTAKPDSDVVLALSIKGLEATWQFAKFISHRRGWRVELEAALGLAVQLERARRDATPEAGYVELWRRA